MSIIVQNFILYNQVFYCLCWTLFLLYKLFMVIIRDYQSLLIKSDYCSWNYYVFTCKILLIILPINCHGITVDLQWTNFRPSLNQWQDISALSVHYLMHCRSKLKMSHYRFYSYISIGTNLYEIKITFKNIFAQYKAEAFQDLHYSKKI